MFQIAELLKKSDPERYYFSLILPEKYRQAVQGLYAFNAEIAVIASRISEPGPGEIRLQYWRDILDGNLSNDSESNPVAEAVLNVLQDNDLPAVPLLRLIAARRFDLYADPMPDMKSFEGYAGETVSILYQYAGQMLNGGEPLASGDAAGHLGVAHALIGHLRSFGLNASRHRLFLPLSVFTAHGVSEHQIFTGETDKNLSSAVALLIQTAFDHLNKAGVEINKIPRHVRPAFAAISVLDKQLKLLERSDMSPLREVKIISNRQIIARLVLWTLKNG